MHRIPHRVVTLVGVVVSTMMACAAAPEESQGPAAFALDGVFTVDEGPGAGIDEIELRGDRYRMLADGCAGEDCEARGSFELDLDARVLRLVDDRTSETTSVPVDFDEADADAEEELAPPEGDIRPQQLLKKPQKLLVKRRVRLLRRVKMNQRKYAKQAGTCSASQIADAQAQCRRQCQGGKSKGINYCSSSGGSRPNFSCACTGGGGGVCATIQNGFRKCMERASVTNCATGAVDCRGQWIRDQDARGLDDASCPRPVIRGGCAGY